MHCSSLFKRTPLAILIAVSCSMPTIVMANESDNPDLEVIEVWGTTISDSNSLLDEDIARKQAGHLSDLLRDQPGVDVGGSHTMNQGINIRGVSELDLNITIDGANQTNNVFHHVGNLLINADILKAVDIQVGNNSILNSGLGGGVAFETKSANDLLRPGQRVGARVNSGFATNNYYHYSGTGFAQLTDTVDTLVYYSVLNKDNPVDGDGVEQIGFEGQTDNYLVKLGWEPNAANRFDLAYDSYKDAGDYSTKSNMGMDWPGHEDSISPKEYIRETITLNHTLALTSTDVKSTLYYNEMNYKSESNTDDTYKEGNTENYGLKVLAQTSFDIASTWHTARYGFELNSAESKNIIAGEVNEDSVENSDFYAVYLENEMELFDGFFLTPGVRYNNYKVDMAASDKTFTDTIFALAAQYDLTSDWTVRASATELFKGPGLTGSYLTSGSDVNPDLKPETGINYEAAIAYQTNQFAGLDAFGTSLTVFKTELNDYIDDVMTGKVSLYDNAGDAEIIGMEAVVNARYSNLSGRLTYAKSESEFTSVADGSSIVLGQALDDAVGDSISLNLNYDFENTGLSLGWNSRYTFELDLKDPGTDREGNPTPARIKDSYHVHDINLMWTPAGTPDLTVTAALDNIFDELYYSHASHDLGSPDYEPGRNFKLSVAYLF
ncbi:TonB-dependent receptor domain-containing protein [Vibrio sp. WXL103]|uniref:TonB-dependent receptor domain-containing protein n=1 Tax=unclassified Vibrio TaxID=2614977 RepID=UPI003EC61FE2